MWSSGPNYSKLKTNLRLAVTRLKLLEKKKTELALKSRKEIADYLVAGKLERAKIRVEQIIREDYYVEAMEVVEMYCDLLLARFGLLQQMKDLDDGIAEPVSSLIWVAPRLQSDVEELRIISDVLATKYGKEFTEMSRTATGEHKVSEKLMHKLAIQAPPKLLVEKYLIEIAKIFNVEYEPDQQVLQEEPRPIGLDGMLIDLNDRNRNNLGGGGSGGAFQPLGFKDFPLPPALPVLPNAPKPFEYGPSSSNTNPPFNYNIPPYPNIDQEKKDINTFMSEENRMSNYPPPYAAVAPDNDVQFRQNTPHRPPSYSSITKPNTTVKGDDIRPSSEPKPSNNLPPAQNDFNFPSVPLDLPDVPADDKQDNDDIDFDDLSKRFEELKKKK